MRRIFVLVALASCFPATVSPALGEERDTSFLKPGITRFAEVKAQWDVALGEYWGPPDASWDEEVYKEKPHIYLLPASSLTMKPPPQPSKHGQPTELVVSPEEAKAWTLINVKIFRYRRFLSTSTVGTQDSAALLHLAFTKDEQGNPDRLLYYTVDATEAEETIDWDETVRRLGPSLDQEYRYINHRRPGDVLTNRTLLYRRFPARGVGYIWDAGRAKDYGTPPSEAKNKFFAGRVHFEPEKK